MITIEETIRKRINESINEELSIADDVYRTSQNILETIINRIQKEPYTKFKEGIKIQRFSFNEYLLSRKIVISVIHYNFGNKYYFEKNSSLINYDDGDRYNIIKIFCYSLSGALDRASAMNTIQHEVEHIYQGLKGSKNITQFNSLYTKAIQELNRNTNIENKILSNVIYLSYKFEDDGYINGLYGFLMEKEELPTFENIKQTPVYKLLLQFREQLNIIIRNKENYNLLAFNTYGITISSIFKKARNAEKYLINRIGKIIIKVTKDKKSKGNFLATTKGKITDFNI